MSEEKKVKILHIYKSEPNDTVKKLVEILIETETQRRSNSI